MHPETPCPDDELLGDLVAGRVTLAAHPEVERHLGGCPACQEIVAVALRGPGEPGHAPDAKVRVVERVAHYRIEHRLGRGAMGEVFRGFDERLNRPVAIKLLPVALAGNALRQRRLVREARAAARLNHHGIVTVHEVGSWRGQVYVVMEVVEGTRFTEVARAGCAPAVALRLVAETADALGAAHAAGIYHRDVKGDNLLVTGDGRVKVLDFGLAKQVIADSDAGDPIELSASDRRPPPTATEEVGNADTAELPGSPEPSALGLDEADALSRAGEIIGTPAYMSPEQTLGQPTDARSEVFSLGVVLYELLAGVRPFDRPTVAGTLEAVRGTSPVPPSRRARARRVSRAVDAVVARALARRPEDRYPDMAAFAADCRRVLGARGRAIRWLAVAGVATAVAGVVGLVAVRRDGDPLRPARVIASRRLTFSGGCEELPRFTPDGRAVIFDSSHDGDYDVFALDLDGAGAPATPRRLTRSPAWDYGAALSPDGQWLAYHHGDDGLTVMLQPLDAAAGPAPIAIGASRSYVSFAPDGRLLGGNGDGEIFAWELDGRGGVRATHVLARLPAGTYARYVIAFPDGGLVAALSDVNHADNLPLVEIERGAVSRIEGESTPFVGGMAPSRDGRGYYYVRSAMAGQSQLAWRRRGQPGPGVVVEGGLAPRAGLALDGSGTRLVFSTCAMFTQLVRLRDGGEVVPWSGAGAWSDRHARALPDGRVLLSSDRDGRFRLWQVGRDGDERPIGDWDVHSFAVSRDGLLVYRDAVRGGLRLVPLDGSGAPRPLTTGTTDQDPRFTHDGARVIFGREEAGVEMIYAVPVAGGEASPLTQGTNAEVARDVDRIAFVRFAPGGASVLVTDARGTAPVAVPNLDPGTAEGAIAISADGQRLLVATRSSSVIEIGADGSDRRTVWAGKTEGIHTVAWAPDGDGLLATRVLYRGNLWIADGAFR